MRSTTFRPLSLADFEISPEQGFLPQDPIDNLPDCPTLSDLGHELPKLLSARMVRQFINDHRHRSSSFPSACSATTYRAPVRSFSFAGHPYVWETPDRPAMSPPPQLAQPWCDMAKQLGRPPVLSYASYALDNWR